VRAWNCPQRGQAHSCEALERVGVQFVNPTELPPVGGNHEVERKAWADEDIKNIGRLASFNCGEHGASPD
jgi:hypothetical protein